METQGSGFGNNTFYSLVHFLTSKVTLQVKEQQILDIKYTKETHVQFSNKENTVRINNSRGNEV